MTNSTRSQWHRRRLHPQRANGGPARDPRADPRPGPRLYDDSPDAASSTYAVASAQSPASEAARTAPHPPGGPPPEEADGAVYILPPSTPLFQPGMRLCLGTQLHVQRAPRRALVRRPEGTGNPHAPLGTNASILS